MKKIALYVATLFFLEIPLHSYAWGENGHKIIAKIAYSQLNTSVRDSIARYLDGMSFEDVGNWMNTIRADHSYDYMRPWHYINFEKNEKYDPSKKDNIMWALNKAIKELEHRTKYPKEQIALDLKVVIFLVGTLHQPLHVGYSFDRGGNDVTLDFKGQPTNLHKVWNEDIINTAIVYDTVWCNTNSYSKTQLAELEKTDLVKWMNESRSKLNVVYDYKGTNIDQAYIEKNIPVIKTQLLDAGLRLSYLLDHIFGEK